MKFKLFKWDVSISMGNSYWGNEPKPLKASWRFEIEVDYNNDSKREYNYDLSLVLTEDMRGCWVCFGPLNKSVLDYDIDLQVLSKRLKEKGLEGTYWRYPSKDYLHTH
jgi:hypothetical protein